MNLGSLHLLPQTVSQFGFTDKAVPLGRASTSTQCWDSVSSYPFARSHQSFLYRTQSFHKHLTELRMQSHVAPQSRVRSYSSCLALTRNIYGMVISLVRARAAREGDKMSLSISHHFHCCNCGPRGRDPLGLLRASFLPTLPSLPTFPSLLSTRQLR